MWKDIHEEKNLFNNVKKTSKHKSSFTEEAKKHLRDDGELDTDSVNSFVHSACI
jgi:hypothetical protein